MVRPSATGGLYIGGPAVRELVDIRGPGVSTESAYTAPTSLHGVTEPSSGTATDVADGRPILLAVGVSVVLVSGLIGFFVGSNGSVVGPEARLFGLVTVPTTPATMAGAGMVLALLLLGTLFALVELASRLEDTDGA